MLRKENSQGETIDKTELKKEDNYMGRAILALFVTLVVGLLTMSIFTGAAEVGIVVAIAVMGAFVIYFNEKNK